MLYYKKKILTHVTNLMNLENIMLSDINTDTKNKYCMVILI